MADLKIYFEGVLLFILLVASFVVPIALIFWAHAKIVKKRLRRENPHLSEYGIEQTYEPFTPCTFFLSLLSLLFISFPILIAIRNYVSCV